MRRVRMFEVGGLLLAFGVMFAAAGCGDDDEVICPTGQTQCMGVCVNLQDNEANCGMCGAACMGMATCNMGTCGAICAAPSEMCGDECINTNTDNENCGDCGNACDAGEFCVGGTCMGTCGGPDSTLMMCGVDCVDTATDEANCGACDNACPAGQNCVDGDCACPTGTTPCGDTCANTQNDAENCGTCGTACDAGEFCIRGDCQPTCGGMPGSPLMMCGADCVDTTNDPANCGECDNACPSGQFCVGGACACGGDLTDCDGACVDLQSDSANCSACGMACADGEICNAGVCDTGCGDLDRCGTGCADLQNDPTNCGMCGNACPAGQTCSAGACSCGPGFRDCGGTCVPTNDPNNCGACGTVCSGATPVCNLDVGTGVAACASGCNPMVPSEMRCGGSCVDTSNNNAHCGSCGNSCGGGSTCTAGACSCGSLTDCDPSATAFSCVDLASDRNNCGACGTACAAGQACITAGGTTSCQVATPTGLRVDCGPTSNFPAGAGSVQCRAFLTFGGGVPDQDVTTAPETTWPAITTSNCTGSAVCGTPNGPTLGTTGTTRGVFTPAGSIDAAAITSNVTATPNVVWRRGSVMLSDDIALVTEPAMAIGYRIDPENITLPYLFDSASRCVGATLSAGSGLSVRFRLLRTYAGGGVSEVPASTWTITSAAGAILSGGFQCDGSVVAWETTAPGGLSAPRAHTLTARVAGTDVATTTVTVTNEGRDRLRVTPTAQTTGRGVPTGRFQAFVDFGALAFEVTTLGDYANIGTRNGCDGNAHNGLTYPYYWNCDGTSSSASTLYPWISAPSGENITTVPVPSTTSTLLITGYGVFTPATSGTDGVHTVTDYFPYQSAGSPNQTNFTVTVSGRQAVACRLSNIPSTLSVNAATPALGTPLPGDAVQVKVAYSTGASIGTCGDAACSSGARGSALCTYDGGLYANGVTGIGACNAAGQGDYVCVAGACRALESAPPGSPAHQVPQTSAIAWTSSAPSFVTVSNADGSRGQLRGVAPGTSNIGATYTDSFGTVACTSFSTATVPSTTTLPVNVVPSMLCDIIVTTRPFSATANAASLPYARGGSGDYNRTAASFGIGDGLVATPDPGGSAGRAGTARRRAYYGVHLLPDVPVGATGDDALANDPRVLLPNVAGITQQFTAVGYYARDGMSAHCTTAAGSSTIPSPGGSPIIFPQDITSQVSWDVVGTTGSINAPNFTGTALTTDAALTVSASGLGTVVASSTADRLQAVRATINSGERYCTGNGSAIGGRATTNPCVHALGFEVCGAPDTTAGSVVTSPWVPPNPSASNRSFYPVGVTNPIRESYSPTTVDTDFYETFVSDTAIRYYSLQRFTGTCTLSTGSSYRMDFSERAAWTTSNPGIGTVSGGGLSALAAGTTSITSSQTFGATTLTDSLDFRVAAGVINGISASPTAAVAEVLQLTEGNPLPILAGPVQADLKNEVWLNATFTTTAGSPPALTLGGNSENLQWRLQSGSTNCLEQYLDTNGPGTAGGDSWVPFGTVGMPVTGETPTSGYARFRAVNNIPGAGCSVVLRPSCRSGGSPAQTCAPGMGAITYGDVTFTVRRGSVSASNFFIQAPHLTCNDPPAPSHTLARYRTTTPGIPNGMGADFYVCTRPSFGAWLRFDTYYNAPTDHPNIGWSVSVNPTLLVDGASSGPVLSDSGYIRYNPAVSLSNAVLNAQFAAVGLGDSLDIFVDTDVAESLALVSPNTGTSASAACTTLAAGAPGSGTIESCLLGRDPAVGLTQPGQAELYRVTATGPGITAPIDVTSDHLIVLAVADGSVPGPTPAGACGAGSWSIGGPWDQIITAQRPALTSAGYCNARITADVTGITSVNVAQAAADLAILTGTRTSFTTSTPAITMTGAGAIGVVATSAVASTTPGLVTVNTSWWNVGLVSGVPGVATAATTRTGLVSTNPFAANPWTSAYWTPGYVPDGIDMLGATGDLVIPGMPEYSFLYAGPVPAAQTSSVVARIPEVSSSANITVTVNP